MLSAYSSRSVVKWPRSKSGIDKDAYSNIKSSLLETIKKARAGLAIEVAGGRRRALEESIARARKLLSELERVG